MNDAQQPLNALPQGHRLQEYELVRVLGFGGFGMTYLGFDHNLDKAVAIKEYLPSDIAIRTGDNSVVPQASQFRDDFEWGLDRFLDEARALARFDHRHIIKVHRFFEAHGTAYIVMEYAEGETLSAFLERKETLKEAELKAILSPILDGLEVVHGVDFLHRDIKPGNIIIRDEDNSPVLLDFGSARQAISARSRSVTSIITPGYAPIEQYSSRGDQGPWTDIYALGGVCYRALTGEVPNDATDRVRNDPLIPVVERCTGQASAEFLSAIDWALAVDEGNRPQSVVEWRARLEGEPVTTSPPIEESSIAVAPVEEMITPPGVSQSVTPEAEQQGKRHGKVLLGILGVCLLLTGLGGYLWWEKKNHEAEIVRYVAQFEEALGRKDFSMAGIYVDSLRAVDSDAPMLSELEGRLSKARQVSDLLSGATEDMAADRLTSPTGQNAWEKYQSVLELEPEHGVATAGLDSIIARYVVKFESALERKDFSMADEYVARIRAVYADAPMLSEMESCLSTSQAERQRQEQAVLESQRQEQIEKQRFVADVGRDPSPFRVNNVGETDLHIAASLNLPILTLSLLKQNANVNAKDKYGSTPLHDALWKDAHETAEILLKQGADVNAKTQSGNMPLHFAAEKNDREIAEVLLKQGADVNAKNKYDYTPLHDALWKDAHETAEVLLKHGADVNAKTQSGNMPLHFAAEKNDREIAEVLLKQGADVNAKDKDGDTPLHFAAKGKAHETAEVLLKHGADINAKNKDGDMPLHFAAEKNAHETAEVLLKHGADVNAKPHGWTPLHSAAISNARETAEVLLKHGADVNAKILGRTPLFYATQREMIEVLRRYGGKR